MIATTLLPIAAVVLFFAFAVATIASNGVPMRRGWLVPAALCLVFLVFSLYTVAVEGPLGFWANHSLNLWGNQVWFDLLLAIGIGWFFIVPLGRPLGMRLPIWLLIIISTGCIGFLAMLARLLYLREARGLRN